MKKGIFIAAIALLAGEAFAQKAELTSAILSLRKQDMPTAKSYIDKAEVKLNAGGTLKAKDLSKFWYNKGLVYYSLYSSSKDVTLLDAASNAFKIDSETSGSSYAKKSSTELIRCAIAYNNAAYDKYDSKEFSIALSLFEKVVEVNSYPAIGKVDTSNLYNASLMAVQAKDSDKAIKLFTKLIELDSSNGDYHISLIKQYSLQENKEARFKAIKDGRSKAPSHTGLIFEEVNYYLSENNNEELLISLESAIIAAPDNKILHFAKGSALGTLKKFEEAKKAYLAAIALDADYFDAYNNLGSLYLDQAAPLVDKMNNLGLSQADQKKYNSLKKQRNALYSQAKPFLEEAVRIDDTAYQVLSALKDVCYQTDDIDCWKRTNTRMKELSK
jgi:tetratricopeptide (TPR) repeat protein